MAGTQSIFNAPEAETPEYYKPLSLKLYQVLEDVDTTVENRENMIEASTFSDILGTISHLPTFTWNTFGSAYEGSTTYDMNSDVDNVLVYQDFQVVEDSRSAPPGKSLLVIQDENTPAGYAKLQLMHNKIPLFAKDAKRVVLGDDVFDLSFDKHGRMVLSYNISGVSNRIKSRTERHGPAMSVDPDRSQLAKDIVFALGCSSFPACATEWLRRRRRYHWPSSSLIESCKTLGYILVYIGHPLSAEEQMQWRVSLSFQERLLVSQFNSVQLKCFILLKLIKKDVISKRMLQESLSSYHLKTCMLYMIENTPAEFWKPENLLTCLVRCLERLQMWVEDGVCPNYFIPDENMFERKVSGKVREDLRLVLRKLLSEDCKYIMAITTTDVGERLRVAVSPEPSKELVSFDDEFGRNVSQIGRLDLLNTISLYILNCRNTALKQDFSTVDSGVRTLFNKLRQLRTTKKVTVYTEQQTKRAVSFVTAYIEVSLMSNIVALSVKRNDSRERVWSLVSSVRWREISRLSDRVTAKLKQATLMHMCGFYESSIDMLKSIEGHDGFLFCDCEPYFKTQAELKMLLHTTRNKPNITIEEFTRGIVKPCIIFLPTERHLVPLPLQYEMRRSEGLPVGSRHEPFYFWYDWAVIDANVLLCLLMYLNYKQLSMEKDAKSYFDRINSSAGIGATCHKDTTWNIRGWMYKDRGYLAEAKQMFEMSLAWKPHHNAAVRHLDDLSKA